MSEYFLNKKLNIFLNAKKLFSEKDLKITILNFLHV